MGEMPKIGGNRMELTALFLSEFDREVARSRRALEQVPAGKHDWKPHEKSMIFGYLAGMVATIPSWIATIVTQGELDIAPKDGPPTGQAAAEHERRIPRGPGQLRRRRARRPEGHERRAPEDLWRLLAGGKVVAEMSRHEMIRDTINHWAHHRGQMTVYLRLMGATVPALYRTVG